MVDPGQARSRWWRSIVGAVALGVVVGLAIRVQGIPRRWEWWTGSPNDLGAVLAASLPVLIGLLVRYGWREGNDVRWWILAPTALGAIVAISGIVGSCSRGGVLAAVVACLIMTLLAVGIARRFSLVALIVLAAALAVAPRAGPRMVIDPIQDQSVATRVSLMRASAMMIADRPSGWGAQQFGDVCERWYLDRAREVSLWHPLNDTLWLGTERGVLAMAAFLALALALVVGLAHLGRAGDPLATGLAAGVSAFLVAGCTTGLLRPGGIAWTMIGFAGVALSYFASRALRMPMSEWKWTAVGGCTGLAITAAWWGVGAYLVATWPYRPAGDSTVSAAPRAIAQPIMVAVIQSDGDMPTTICRQVLRPLIDQGLAATCLTKSSFKLWPGRNAPHVLLVLREVISDQPLLQLVQPETRGVIVLDLPPQEFPPTAPKCPILLVSGTTEGPTSASLWDTISKAHTANRTFAAPVPYCWPRHFGKISEALSGWIHEVTASPYAAAD